MLDAPSDIETSLQATAVRPARAKSSAAWAVAGFITGALFWHTIGFWSFVQSTLLPGSDLRRAERDPPVADTRTTSSAGMHSPVRPTRAGPKTVTKWSEAPAPVPTVLNPTEVADCVTLSRSMPGGSMALSPCVPLAAPLAVGAGVELADREPAKSAAFAQPAVLLWQAKVEVSAGQR